MSKMMTEVGGFQGVPTDCQLMVAKLVMQRQQLESVHNMVMPREFRKAIDKGHYLRIKHRLRAKEWSVHTKDPEGNTPLQRCLNCLCVEWQYVDNIGVALRKVLSVLLQHGGKPPVGTKFKAYALDIETMTLLVQIGLKINVLENYAYEANHIPYDRAYVRFLMQTIKPDNDECQSALYFAIRNNEVSLNNVKLLLEEGCDRGLQVSEHRRKHLLDRAKEQNEAVHALLCAELTKEPPAKRARTE
jgi:hypothetical protein